MPEPKAIPVKWLTSRRKTRRISAWKSPCLTEPGSQAKPAIGHKMTFANHTRPHTCLGGTPPAGFYQPAIAETQADQQAQKVTQLTPKTAQAMAGSSVKSFSLDLSDLILASRSDIWGYARFQGLHRTPKRTPILGVWWRIL